MKDAFSAKSAGKANPNVSLGEGGIADRSRSRTENEGVRLDVKNRGHTDLTYFSSLTFRQHHIEKSSERQMLPTSGRGI